MMAIRKVVYKEQLLEWLSNWLPEQQLPERSPIWLPEWSWNQLLEWSPDTHAHTNHVWHSGETVDYVII